MTRARFRALLTLVCLVFAETVWSQQSQPAAITAVEVLVLPETGPIDTTPAIATRKTPIAAGSPLCNLASTPQPPLPLVNPLNGELDDPFTAGRVCRVPIPTGLPNGVNLRGVFVFYGDGVASCQNAAGNTISPCRSERSALATPPFTIAGQTIQPAPPTNPKIRP